MVPGRKQTAISETAKYDRTGVREGSSLLFTPERALVGGGGICSRSRKCYVFGASPSCMHMTCATHKTSSGDRTVCIDDVEGHSRHTRLNTAV